MQSVSRARRRLLAAGLGWPLAAALPGARAQAPAPVAAPMAAEAALRRGGVVLALRHALAPGTFDPPGFRLGDCSTQRNLDDAGRAQARRIGGWFTARGLAPARLRSSPWCRCVDTATLAFGQPEVWPALGSPHGAAEVTQAAQLDDLRQALRVAGGRGGFEVWVTHMFVMSDLAGRGTAAGEGLLLQAGPDGAPQVLATWAPA